MDILVALRSVLRVGRKEFCEKYLHIPYNTLLCWESRRVRITVGGRARVLEALERISNEMPQYDWILGEGKLPTEVEHKFLPSIDEQEVQKHVLKVLLDKTNFIVFRITDKSMSAFNPGQIVAGRRRYGSKGLEVRVGETLIFEIMPGRYTIRVLSIDDLGRYSLYCTNPADTNPLIRHPKIYSWSTVTFILGMQPTTFPPESTKLSGFDIPTEDEINEQVKELSKTEEAEYKLSEKKKEELKKRKKS